MMLPAHLERDGASRARRLFAPARAKGVGVARGRQILVVGEETAPFAHAEAIRDRAREAVAPEPVPRADHRLETINRAPLFNRIRKALSQGGTP